ncbi:MAG: DEAD/DEAH box helicase family protein [Candidatus Nanoarchaeia archaeon]|nr:DEAD/DEAH box helicase family protein [Candidatus Nanoarchaeia archaeon]
MKLKFKQQQYQEDASYSVINCFKGQEKKNRRDLIARYTKIADEGTFLERKEEVEVISFGNHPITLTNMEIRNNIRVIQKENNINYTDNAGVNDFTIEMETGTGKTYTYINTMYKLNEKYGWSKFIVMVPSIAIREGVQKSFEITQDHFQELYHKKIKTFVYNSASSSNLANINNFASDNSIQVMIINYQAFNAKSSANRRIYEELDQLQSRRPIDVIKSVRPILIIDEPQKFGDKTEELFSEFNPLFTIRYSATHKKNKEYNKIYRLDAIEAYNQKLVKKINVKGIEVLNNKSEDTYLFLESIDISQKHDPIAKIEIDVKSSSGTTRKLIKIKAGDDLYYKSGELTPYKGYVVSEIDARYESYDKVVFTNGVEIEVGQAFGDVDEDHIVRIQIRETIKSHFEKEKELYKLGIKVLSLFFIDEVAKYKYYENSNALKGKYAKIFEEEYVNVLNEFRNFIDEDYKNHLDSFNTGKIHAGYFSIDKKGHEIDPAINDKKEYLSFDEDAYDLIMKDKERLLSLEEPVRFIFSHSALREGWDNPNIFQICTLKHSNSDISKRQEIGRGLRICVNNDGDRMDSSVLEKDFHSINVLTVVASESYDSFAKALQTEISQSLSDRPIKLTFEYLNSREQLENKDGEILKFDSTTSFNFMNMMKNNNYVDDEFKITNKFIEDVEKDEVKFEGEFVNFSNELIQMTKKIYETANFQATTNANKENIKALKPNSNFMKKEFQDLWNKINIKTVYEVKFDTKELVEKAINSINSKLNINKMKVRITEGSQKENITSILVNTKESMTEAKSKVKVIEDFSPSQIKYDLIGELTKGTGLTRKTIIEILSSISLDKFEIYKYNPEEFIRKVSNIINEEKASTVIDGITYHKTEQKYDNEIFTINNVNGELGKNAIDVKKHIYDFLITDSQNETNFAKKLETGEVTVYAKLPNGFKIPTPVGNYNPDWAIVFDNKDFKYVYFIAETKGSMSTMELREVEKAKIECARRHFKCLCNDVVKYDVVDSYESLINIIAQ